MSKKSFWVSSPNLCSILSVSAPDVDEEKKNGLVSLNMVDWETEAAKKLFRNETVKKIYESGDMITDYCLGYADDNQFSECLICLEEDNPEELVIKGFFAPKFETDKKSTLEHFGKILAIVIDMLITDLENGGYRILSIDIEESGELKDRLLVDSFEGAVSTEYEEPVSLLWDDELVDIIGNLDCHMMDVRFNTIKEKLVQENISYEYEYEDFALPMLRIVATNPTILLRYEIIREADDADDENDGDKENTVNNENGGTRFALIAQSLEPVGVTEDGEPIFFRDSFMEEEALYVDETVEWIKSVIFNL